MSASIPPNHQHQHVSEDSSLVDTDSSHTIVRLRKQWNFAGVVLLHMIVGNTILVYFTSESRSIFNVVDGPPINGPPMPLASIIATGIGLFVDLLLLSVYSEANIKRSQLLALSYGSSFFPFFSHIPILALLISVLVMAGSMLAYLWSVWPTGVLIVGGGSASLFIGLPLLVYTCHRIFRGLTCMLRTARPDTFVHGAAPFQGEQQAAALTTLV